MEESCSPIPIEPDHTRRAGPVTIDMDAELVGGAAIVQRQEMVGEDVAERRQEVLAVPTVGVRLDQCREAVGGA